MTRVEKGDRVGIQVRNRWTWNLVANIVYIEQPVGVGFSHRTDPAARNREDRVP